MSNFFNSLDLFELIGMLIALSICLSLIICCVLSKIQKKQIKKTVKFLSRNNISVDGYAFNYKKSDVNFTVKVDKAYSDLHCTISEISIDGEHVLNTYSYEGIFNQNYNYDKPYDCPYSTEEILYILNECRKSFEKERAQRYQSSHKSLINKGENK